MYKKLLIALLNAFIVIQTMGYLSQLSAGPEPLQKIALRNLSNTLKSDCNKPSCPNPEGFLESFANAFTPLDVLDHQQFLINENFWPALGQLLWQRTALQQFVNNPAYDELNQKITRVLQNPNYQDPQYQIIPKNITNTFSIPIPQAKLNRLEQALSEGVTRPTINYISSKNIAIASEFFFLNYIGFYKVNFADDKPSLLYQDTLTTFSGEPSIAIDKKSMVAVDGQGRLVSYTISPHKISKDAQTRLSSSGWPILTPFFLIIKSDKEALFFERNARTGTINLQKPIYQSTFKDTEDAPRVHDIFMTKNNEFIIIATKKWDPSTPTYKAHLKILKIGPKKSIQPYRTLVIQEERWGDWTWGRVFEDMINEHISPLKTVIEEERFYAPYVMPTSSIKNQKLFAETSYPFNYPLTSTNVLLDLKVAARRGKATFFDILKNLLKRYETVSP